jgi:hypothetical protein
MPPARALAIVASLSALGFGLVAAYPLSAQPLRNGPLPQPLPLFPADNWWNVDISAAPVDANSASYISALGGSGRGMHPDFGGFDTGTPDPNDIYGIPYVTVPGNQPRVPLTFVEFGSQSDSGFPGLPSGYPIPEEAKTQGQWIEGGQPGNVDPGGDRHMLIVDTDNRVLYEIYRAFWDVGQNRWEASSAAIYSLAGNERRPETWTSADAAGLAILPGLVRYDEVFTCTPFDSSSCVVAPDPIRHAFRFTAFPVEGYVFPASHDATTSQPSDPWPLPLGARLRLKSSVNLSGYAPYIQKIFQAMKTYGLILADNGSDMYVQGAHDPRWNNGQLNPAFSAIRASDFEVVQLGWQPSTTQPVLATQFHTTTPCRLLDTRLAAGAYGYPPLWPAWTQAQRPGAAADYLYPNWRVVKAHGRCNIPAAARAVSVNVTVANTPAGGGFLSIFPGDQGPPATTTLNFGAGQNRANNMVVTLAASGSGTFAIRGHAAAPFDVIVDVNGWFQ